MADIERIIKNLELVKDGIEWISPLDYQIMIDEAIQTIRELQGQIPKWHLCSEELPLEHDSMFARFKGTNKWNCSMFEKTSNEVLVAIKDEKGRCATTTASTADGKWKCDLLRAFSVYEVIAWMELPKFEEVE